MHVHSHRLPVQKRGLSNSSASLSVITFTFNSDASFTLKKVLIYSHFNRESIKDGLLSKEIMLIQWFSTGTPMGP